MTQVLFTPLATEDLQQIWEYLAENAGNETASKFLIAIRDKCRKFAEFPEAGRERNDLIVNLRSFPLKNYIVFYLPLNEGIEVLRIIHAARDIPQIFDEMIPLEP